MSMALDGFVTGPNAGVGNPLGDDHGRLHVWMADAASDHDAATDESAERPSRRR